MCVMYMCSVCMLSVIYVYCVYLYVYVRGVCDVYVCMCIYVYCVCAGNLDCAGTHSSTSFRIFPWHFLFYEYGTHGGQKRASDPLELELQLVVSRMWLLGAGN